jgi:hypothetical protein
MSAPNPNQVAGRFQASSQTIQAIRSRTPTCSYFPRRRVRTDSLGHFAITNLDGGFYSSCPTPRFVPGETTTDLSRNGHVNVKTDGGGARHADRAVVLADEMLRAIVQGIQLS